MAVDKILTDINKNNIQDMSHLFFIALYEKKRVDTGE